MLNKPSCTMGSCTAACTRTWTADFRAPLCACLQVVSNHTGELHVCVGNEWYRYPSSFFLPSPSYRLRFIKSDFHGLLPRPFSPEEVSLRCSPSSMSVSGIVLLGGQAPHSFHFMLGSSVNMCNVKALCFLAVNLIHAEPQIIMQGGTAAASPHFNDRNKEDAANFWSEDALCNSLVLLQDHSQPPPEGGTSCLSAAQAMACMFQAQKCCNPLLTETMLSVQGGC